MAEALHFWQGKRKIEVREDASALTIHAASEADARSAADRAGIQLESVERAAPGLMRAQVAGDLDSSMSRLRTSTNVVHHVYRNVEAPDVEYLITDSFFVKFKPNTSEQRIRDYFQAENLVIDKDLGDLTYLVRVTTDTGRNPIRTANAAQSRTDVEYAEPNLVRQLTRFAFIPPDERFAEQWHLHAPADSAPDLLAGAGIFAADAWEVTRGRRDIVVAVADDGFDLTHPDFQGAGKVAAKLNALATGNTLQWDNDVRPRAAASQFESGDYHGTPCLGVAVAEGNGTGVVGVAPGCSLVAVRFPLSMADSQFVEMFRKISPLADVLSCSWGVGPADAPMSSAMHDAIATLSRTGGRRGKGLIFCVAAGNNNCPVKDIENTRTYRFRGDGGVLRSYSGPIDRWIAAHPDVITVSACTSLTTRAAYSSWGKEICVCAPSDNWDDLNQSIPPGRGITTTDNEGFGLNTDFSSGSRFTNRFGGTSSATPTVAGTCALVLSANPSLSASRVRDILKETADKNLSLVSHTPVNEPGTFNASGFSLWFGYGKVNAQKAVQMARAELSAEQLVTLDVRANLEIPDVGSPVVSPMQISNGGKINELRVSVNITHTYIGDLRVDLLAPDGTAVVLHNNTGGSANDLVRTYSALQTPAMQSLIGKEIAGTWRLRVSDQFRFDVGKLNSWRIAARLAQPIENAMTTPERTRQQAA
jgi:subtilisin-like proprotein convertase family protein/subtilisin family serine protease